MIGIYAIRHKESGKVYIGSSSTIRTRWNRHRWLLRNNRHFSQHLQAAWNKYGSDAFEFLVIEQIADADKLIEREQYWVDCHKANNAAHGYNRGIVVESRRGVPQPPEAIRKIIAALTGRQVSEATRKKLSMINTGKRHSEETKRKMSMLCKGKAKPPMSVETKAKLALARRGKPLSVEHRKKLSESHRGYQHTPEQKQKIARALKGIPKPPRSDEHRRKLSLAKMGKQLSPEHVRKIQETKRRLR